MASLALQLRRTAATTLAVLIGCAPSESAPQVPASPASSSGAEQATGAPSTTAAPAPTETEEFDSYMEEHFVVVTYARDAVIVGNLVGMRQALGGLAGYKYEHVTPGEWQPWVVKLQAAAKPGTTAKTLLEASQAIANTAAVCGECHVAHGSGPVFLAADRPEPDSRREKTLSKRMERHVWAADRMWEGLIAPSEAAWREGVNELSTLPATGPKERPPLPAEFLRELQEVRALGKDARAHDSSAALYARVLTTCAGCHERELEESSF